MVEFMEEFTKKEHGRAEAFSKCFNGVTDIVERHMGVTIKSYMTTIDKDGYCVIVNIDDPLTIAIIAREDGSVKDFMRLSCSYGKVSGFADVSRIDKHGLREFELELQNFLWKWKEEVWSVC